MMPDSKYVGEGDTTMSPTRVLRVLLFDVRPRDRLRVHALLAEIKVGFGDAISNASCLNPKMQLFPTIP